MMPNLSQICQKPSKTIKNHQKPSKTIKNHQKPSKTYRISQELWETRFRTVLDHETSHVRFSIGADVGPWGSALASLPWMPWVFSLRSVVPFGTDTRANWWTKMVTAWREVSLRQGPGSTWICWRWFFIFSMGNPLFGESIGNIFYFLVVP